MYVPGYGFTVGHDTHLWTARWSVRRSLVHIPTYVKSGTFCTVVQNVRGALVVKLETGEEGYLG